MSTWTKKKTAYSFAMEHIFLLQIYSVGQNKTIQV